MKLPPESVHLLTLLASQARGGFATDHLAAHFRVHRELKPEQKEQITRWFYRLIRQSRRLDYAFEGEVASDSLARHVDLFLHREGVLDEAWLRRTEPHVDWARVLRRFENLEGLATESERWAIEHNLSEAAAQALGKALGPATTPFLEACERPAPRTLRTNLLKGTREKLRMRLEAEGFDLEPTSLATHGLIVTKGGDLFQSLAFREGCFEVQDEGSQLIAELVAPPPGGRVIDLCAGAGGKTLALASLLGGRGHVLALDIYERKLDTLRQRARRAGASNVEAIRIEPEGPLPERVQKQLVKADRVLVDAPCSGLGVLRRNPEAGARLEAEDLQRFTALQRNIVSRVLPHLAPGARLVYSTCTVLPGENEEIVSGLLGADPSLESVRISEILGGVRARPLSLDGGRVMSLRPETHGTDGFFAAVIRRVRGAPLLSRGD